jgi:hypothetical protein
MAPSSYVRPFGVSAMGWLCLCFSALLLVLIAVGYSHPELLLQWGLVSEHTNPTLQNEAVGDFILFGLPTAIAAIVIGFGLLTLRSWARWSLLILFGISLCRAGMLVLGLLAVTKMKFTITPSLAIAMAIDAAIVYYLTRPKVKDAFGEGTNYRV